MSNEKKHAFLSASSAQKWLHCTASAKLEATFPDSSSEYAAEGQLAHEFAALALTKKNSLMKPSVYKARLEELRSQPEYKREMEGYAEQYCDYVTQIIYDKPVIPVIKVEHKVDYSQVAPEGFGTADCILISGTDLYIIDYKYGVGVPVSAIRNPQMMLYALGAINEYGVFYAIKDVHLTIYQPRINNISEYSMTLQSLLEWGNDIVKPKAHEAFEGPGVFCPGEWCDKGFCKAAATCRARAEHYMKLLPKPLTDPALLSPQELGQILTRILGVDKWLKKLQGAAAEFIQKGEAVEGWKLVEGRSNREISDENYRELKVKLKAEGFKEAQLYIKKNLTITELEALVGKAELAEMAGDLIQKPPGKPTLVPESDKREAINNELKIKEMFGGMKNE